MLSSSVLTSTLAFAMLAATERAAAAAGETVGRGDEQAADAAAFGAMHAALSGIAMAGRVVIGSNNREGSHLLKVGDILGRGEAPEVDLALDPLEGTTLTVKAKENALSVLAVAPRGGLMHVPDIYMEKLAVGPGFARDVVDLDAPAGENALRLADAKGVNVREITVCVLDRPRHEKIIADLRKVGARVNLIGDGDVAGVIYTAKPETGVDMYLGQGGAPEGVLAAAALKCVGGQMQARLAFRSDAERARAEASGMKDINRRYHLDDLVSGEAIFVATGVTKGGLLDGVRRSNGVVHTHSLLMSSFNGVSRTIRSTTPVKD
ncbi:MAG: class II fructose-bisphosphatase [Alphaproteobacteria bacterium]|nr:class II fructose-bisphosphatase [Alphaproteobacteria bacterium]